MSQGSVAHGLKFKAFGYRVRVWKYGFEYEKNGAGRVRFFFWAPKPRKEL